jgi:transcriptional regulator NrdR family protein
MPFELETCEKCSGFSHVTDSRPGKRGRIRRRECFKCGHRWSTTEIRTSEYEKLREPVAVMKDALDLINMTHNRLFKAIYPEDDDEQGSS